MRIATVDQVAAIANRVPPRYRALVLVAASGGLRWGELAGLRRQRVDLERGTVTRVGDLERRVAQSKVAGRVIARSTGTGPTGISR
jgi:integrase